MAKCGWKKPQKQTDLKQRENLTSGKQKRKE
jgi:hypothetical protein